MGHYTDSECVEFLTIFNHRLYFKLEKNSFKVAHVMTKPEILTEQLPVHSTVSQHFQGCMVPFSLLKFDGSKYPRICFSAL